MWKNTPRNSFYVLGKNKFKTFLGCAAFIIPVLFSTKYNLFHDFIFCSSNNMFFFINCPLKFQYHPGHLKINITPGYFMYMFVHIRKVFPKNIFVTHNLFFWKAAFVIRKIWRYVGSVWRLVFLQLLLL